MARRIKGKAHCLTVGQFGTVLNLYCAICAQFSAAGADMPQSFEKQYDNAVIYS